MSLIGSIIFPNIKAKQRIKTFTKLIIWRLREYKFSRFNKSQTFKFSDISKYCDQEKILTIRWWESSSNPSVTAGQSSWPSMSSSTTMQTLRRAWKCSQTGLHLSEEKLFNTSLQENFDETLLFTGYWSSSDELK